MDVMKMLDEATAEYEISEHSPTFTAQRMAAEEHVPGMNVAKPVMVKADGICYMCVLAACCKVNLDLLKSQLGASEIELMHESEMADIFPDCDVGAEPPFGNFYGLATLMDIALEADEYIVFQGGTHERAIKMRVSDYMKLAEPRILNFGYHTT